MDTQSTKNTLKEIGTPWAETYIGSGRLTGRLAAEPVYMDTGSVAPGWSYVGDQTEGEFNRDFEWQQHVQCHDSSHSDWACEFCVKAGYIESDPPLGALSFDASGHLSRRAYNAAPGLPEYFRGEYDERLTPTELLAVTEAEYQAFRTKHIAEFPLEAMPESVQWFHDAARGGYAPSVVND